MSKQGVGVLYKGKPLEYVKSLKRTLFSYEKFFNNAQSGWGKHQFTQIKKNTFTFKLGPGFLKPGEYITELDPLYTMFPLTFIDGSVFSIAQTFTYKDGMCLVEKSVIRFSKVIDGKIEYLFHYDSGEGDTLHPPFHLQFEYDTKIETPRFRLFGYEQVGDILSMIVRDRLIE